ncbi:anti-sigma factor antagonist [candidate division KSB1 bacterium]|nr:anti-sigma factor antagonist [candidate division KSB1 bacterium]
MTKKSVKYEPVPFHNKIFFCDIIGYSKLPAASQYECHAQLTRIIRTCLDKLDARLLEDVIALPTGDGLILNYLKAEPDVHLRTALMVLEILEKYNQNSNLPIKLRIGLNTNVDSIVLDLNNKKNIVGVGINLAQRITNLGTHGRILMHRRVYEDLSNYKKYEGKLMYLDDFMVKHGVVISLFQYIDYKAPHIDNTPLKRSDDSDPALTLRDIRKSRVKENILSIHLTGKDKDYFDDLHAYLEEFLDSLKIFQKTKIAVNWIANEMMDNVFRHGDLDDDDDIFLKLDRTSNGIYISTEQPDIPDFNIRNIDMDSGDHFISMLRNRGININVLHADGRLTMACLMPFDFEIMDLKMLDVDHDAEAQEAVPDLSLTACQEVTAAIRFYEMDNGIYLIKLHDKLHEKQVDRFGDLVGKLLNSGHLDIIVDLSDLSYINSPGIAMLINSHRTIRQEGGTIIFVNPHPKIKEIFSMCKLDSILQISKSLEDAIAYFRIFH